MDQNTVEFVRRGYAGASLDFTVDVRDAETFAACVRAIGDHGDFRAEQVVHLLGGDVFGDYMGYAVGRDHSPLIVVGVPFWTHQARSGAHDLRGHRRLLPQERAGLVDRVRRAGAALGADRVTVFTSELEGVNVPHRVRLWWS
ncbi:hypothetical protein GCM10017673_38710 [Streptosporangium violaceochromogenes]|nr:hypothetical protein GCM10017673_38710 [Streptosporangium violaceochromogenes]